MTTKKTITATANHSLRTFTIRTSNGGKYRTYPMSADEFQSCLHNTENDWKYFLSSQNGDYFTV
jgi:hypothetical protein